jgi:predicted GTPase
MHSENLHLSDVPPPTEEEIRELEELGRSLVQPPSHDQEPLTILVIGKVGTGKSTLITNILGKNVAKVGHSFHSETSQLTKYEGEVSGVRVEILETPGLNDNKKDLNEEDPQPKEIKKSTGVRQDFHDHLLFKDDRDTDVTTKHSHVLYLS